MPVYTPKRFAQAVLTTSSTSMYQVPGGASAVLKEILMSNTSANSVDVTVYLVPTPGTAGAASDGNCLVPAVSIPAYTVKPIDLSQVMNASDILAAKATAGTAITFHASGVEIV